MISTKHPGEILETEGIIVMPNNQELAYAKKFGFNKLYRSPVAVWNRAISRKLLPTYGKQSILERDVFTAGADAYKNYNFIYHLQTAQNVTLSADHLETADNVQTSPNAIYALAYQKSADVSLDAFSSRLDSCQTRFSDKPILPVLDPAAKDLVLLKQKCLLLGANGYCAAIILFRNPRQYLAGWQVIKAALDSQSIVMIVIGIGRRWTTLHSDIGSRQISTFASPLVFGSKAIAHYQPWSGGIGSILLMNQHLEYLPIGRIDEGHVRYNGKSRLTTYNALKTKSHYAFSRIDAILQTEDILKRMTPLITPASVTSASKNIQGIELVARQHRIV